MRHFIYYLCVNERIFEGKVPFKKIPMNEMKKVKTNYYKNQEFVYMYIC